MLVGYRVRERGQPGDAAEAVAATVVLGEHAALATGLMPKVCWVDWATHTVVICSLCGASVWCVEGEGNPRDAAAAVALGKHGARATSLMAKVRWVEYFQ